MINLKRTMDEINDNFDPGQNKKFKILNELEKKISIEKVSSNQLDDELTELQQKPNNESTKLQQLNNELTELKKQSNNELTELNESLNNQYKDKNKLIKDVKKFEDEKSFKGLDDNILKGIKLLNLEKLSKFQFDLLSLLKSLNQRQPNLINVNLLRNKELSILLYAYQLIDLNLNQPQILIVVPTMELIEQFTDQAIKLFKYSNISVLSTTSIKDLYTNFKEQIIITSLGAAITTILRYNSIDSSKLKLAIYDSLDLLVSTDLSRKNLAKLFNETNGNSLFFTSSIIEDKVDYDFKKLISNKFIYHNLIDKKLLENIINFYVLFLSKEYRKYGLLKIIKNLKNSSRVIIYSVSKSEGKCIAKLLEENGFKNTYLINGDKSSKERLESIQEFEKIRSNEQSFIVCNYPLILNTFLNKIDLVINYDLPFESRLVNEFFHRISHLDNSNGLPKFTISFIVSCFVSDCNKRFNIENELDIKLIRLKLE